MKPRTTLIVVALFALLAGYLYFFELNKTPEQLSPSSTPRPQPFVFQFNADNIKSIEVTDLRTAAQVQLARGESGWQVLKPLEKPADASMIAMALSELSTLKATRVLTNVANIAQYGFITATLEARITMSDTQQTYALTVGNKTPDSSGYYVVYTGDKSNVFVVDTQIISALMAWFSNPPYQPTPTPTFTPTPPVTPTIEATPTITATETPKP